MHYFPASLAVEAGVAGIIVSNHGARQLDYVPATITALEEVVKASRGRVPVFLDGGIRRGTDVFKALALGASGVFVSSKKKSSGFPCLLCCFSWAETTRFSLSVADWKASSVRVGSCRRGGCEESRGDAPRWVRADDGVEWLSFHRGNYTRPRYCPVGRPKSSCCTTFMNNVRGVKERHVSFWEWWETSYTVIIICMLWCAKRVVSAFLLEFRKLDFSTTFQFRCGGKIVILKLRIYFGW